MDMKSFTLQVKMTLAMLFLGHSSSKVIAGFPGIKQGPVSLCWRRGLQVFVDICEQALPSESSVTGRQLIETPYRLAQSKSHLPPIIIDEVDLSGTIKEQLVSIPYP
jgi:hypothetical protein